MKSRQRFESYIGTTLAYQESQQIPNEILEEMVVRLREGDRSVIDPIIMGHLRLVMGILASHRSRSKAADVEGAAYLGLVEAVHNCCPYIDKYGQRHESALRDNNITYYITATVKYAIKDEYGNNHILRVPPRTIRDKIAKGEKFENLVPGFGMTIRESDPPHMKKDSDFVDENIEMKGGSFIMPFYVPIARTEHPSIEFTEILRRSSESITEQAVINARAESYTYEEVGKRVGLSIPRVCQIVNAVEERFDRYNR